MLRESKADEAAVDPTASTSDLALPARPTKRVGLSPLSSHFWTGSWFQQMARSRRTECLGPGEGEKAYGGCLRRSW